MSFKIPFLMTDGASPGIVLVDTALARGAAGSIKAVKREVSQCHPVSGFNMPYKLSSFCDMFTYKQVTLIICKHICLQIGTIRAMLNEVSAGPVYLWLVAIPLTGGRRSMRREVRLAWVGSINHRENGVLI